jgi:hypothetical protein
VDEHMPINNSRDERNEEQSVSQDQTDDSPVTNKRRLSESELEEPPNKKQILTHQASEVTINIEKTKSIFTS